jgi:hypothetical protein
MNRLLNVVAGTFVVSTFAVTTVMIFDIDIPKNYKIWKKIN